MTKSKELFKREMAEVKGHNERTMIEEGEDDNCVIAESKERKQELMGWSMGPPGIPDLNFPPIEEEEEEDDCVIVVPTQV